MGHAACTVALTSAPQRGSHAATQHASQQVCMTYSAIDPKCTGRAHACVGTRLPINTRGVRAQLPAPAAQAARKRCSSGREEEVLNLGGEERDEVLALKALERTGRRGSGPSAKSSSQMAHSTLDSPKRDTPAGRARGR